MKVEKLATLLWVWRAAEKKLLVNDDRLRFSSMQKPRSEILALKKDWFLLQDPLSHGTDKPQCLKVSSHDPIHIDSVFVCVMEFVGVHTIQFLHPIIS